MKEQGHSRECRKNVYTLLVPDTLLIFEGKVVLNVGSCVSFLCFRQLAGEGTKLPGRFFSSVFFFFLLHTKGDSYGAPFLPNTFVPTI